MPNGPKLRVYKPLIETTEPLPMVVFIHGGGWFAGNLDTEDRTARVMCTGVPAWVVSVDYRCGVDVPLEDEVEDCYLGIGLQDLQEIVLNVEGTF